MITNAHKITKSSLWYSAGQNYNSTRRNVNIQELAQSIDNNAGLAGAYIFLGSDYTPAFFRKGKIRPLEIMKKVPKFAKFFSTLGEEALMEDTLAGIEEFVCYMYGHKHQTSINKVRNVIFEQTTKPKNNQGPLDCIKSMDHIHNLKNCNRTVSRIRIHSD